MSNSPKIQFALSQNEFADSLSVIINDFYKNNKSIIVLCDNYADCEAIDESLWSFEEISFVPHNIYSKKNMTLSPVLIVHKDLIPNSFRYDYLINLSDIVLNKFSHFSYVLELVRESEDRKIISRNHYKYYKSQGFEISTCKLCEVQQNKSEENSKKENA